MRASDYGSSIATQNSAPTDRSFSIVVPFDHTPWRVERPQHRDHVVPSCHIVREIKQVGKPCRSRSRFKAQSGERPRNCNSCIRRSLLITEITACSRGSSPVCYPAPATRRRSHLIAARFRKRLTACLPKARRSWRALYELGINRLNVMHHQASRPTRKFLMS